MTTLVAIIIALSFLLYKNTQELNRSKNKSSEILTSYMNLQKKYDDLTKNNNSRQVVISTKTADSINIKIADIISKYAKKIDGDISIYYKNLATDESVTVDADKKYYMASLYKVILTLFLLDEVEIGNTTLDTPVGTSSAKLSLALEKIITESNNEYAELLADEYGWNTIETKMKERLGIEFNLSEELEITVENVGLLFEEIALALKITEFESNYMLDLLQNQKLTSKLPKYLPSTVRFHNKTGELDDYSHDAGVFYTPKANYVLVFMSKTEDASVTNEQMALMSKEIYEALN